MDWWFYTWFFGKLGNSSFQESYNYYVTIAPNREIESQF